MIRAQIDGNSLVIEGEILSSSGQARGIVEQAKAGADWQLSIGAEVREAELVRDARTVNGREHTGPFYHVTKSVLREVSVVAVGADVATRMKVAARFRLTGENGAVADFPQSGGRTMEFEAWLEEHGIDADAAGEEKMKGLKAAFENGDDPPKLESEPEPEPQAPERKPEPQKVRASAEKTDTTVEPAPEASGREQAEDAICAERERVAAIQDICAGEFPEIEHEAVRAGWNVEETSQKVLKAMRESRPQADFHVSVAAGRSRN
jgi:hypothetical protein